MKKQILSILLLLVSVAAIATEKKDPVKKAAKQVTLKMPFQKLVVNGNVEVILFEDTSATISILDKEKRSAAVSITEANGVLTINRKRSFGKRIQVIIPVKGLHMIEAGGSSTISGINRIESPELLLLVNESCRIQLRTSGTVSVMEGKDVEECYWAFNK